MKIIQTVDCSKIKLILSMFGIWKNFNSNKFKILPNVKPKVTYGLLFFIFVVIIVSDYFWVCGWRRRDKDRVLIRNMARFRISIFCHTDKFGLIEITSFHRPNVFYFLNHIVLYNMGFNLIEIIFWVEQLHLFSKFSFEFI